MSDAGYVIGGWALTGAAIAGYVARLWSRSRRATLMLSPDEQVLPPDEQDRSGWR